MLVGSWLGPLLGRKGAGLTGQLINLLIYFAGCWAIGLLLASLIEVSALRIRDRWFPSRA